MRRDLRPRSFDKIAARTFERRRESQKSGANADEIEDLPIVDGEADDAIIEDADELGEDDVDVEDVVEVEADEDEIQIKSFF